MATKVPAVPKVDSDAQTDHAALHNALALAVNELIDTAGAGGIPTPQNAEVGDALVKKSGEDSDLEWKRLREVPDGQTGETGNVLTKKGVGEYEYEWMSPTSNNDLGWGAITKEWFQAGTSLPSGASGSEEGTVFIIYKA